MTLQARKYAHLGGPFTLATCALCTAAASVALHHANSRADVGFLPILTWLWGGALILGAGTLPQSSPARVFAIACVLRFFLVGTPLHLSDDLYRYLWEGKVLDHDLNPFLLPPSTIHGVDDALAQKVNHPDIPSIYPPIALLWFRLLDLIGGTVVRAQLLTGAVDAAIAAGMASILRYRGKSTLWAMVYALHPLPILESAGSAHLEPIAIAFSVLSIMAYDRKNTFGAGFFGTLGFGAKLLPGALVPASVRQHPWRAITGVLLALSLIAAALSPVLDAGSDLFRAGRNYAEHWSFNGAVFVPLHLALGAWTRPVLLMIGGGGALWALGERDPLVVWRNVAFFFLLCTPTAHPWYALWFIVPALLLGESWAIVLGVAILGGYGVLLSLAEGPWKEQAWLWPLTWIPIALAWLHWARRPSPPSRNQPKTA